MLRLLFLTLPTSCSTASITRTLKQNTFGMSRKSARVSNLGIRFSNGSVPLPVTNLKRVKHFDPPAHIETLAKYASEIVSQGNQTGEGWFLTGEMLELIHTGTNNIVCTTTICLSAKPCGW